MTDIPTLNEQIGEIQRLLSLRKALHEMLISDGWMSDIETKRIAHHEAALMTLRRIRREVLG